jgi:hypothetical protein
VGADHFAFLMAQPLQAHTYSPTLAVSSSLGTAISSAYCQEADNKPSLLIIRSKRPAPHGSNREPCYPSTSENRNQQRWLRPTPPSDMSVTC